MPEIDFDERVVDGDATVVTSEPAVGIVATPNDGAVVAAAILRARRHGYQPIVTALDDGLEGLEFARELDALTVDPKGIGRGIDHWAELSNIARRMGFPGLIVHRDPAERIDYGESYAVLEETNRYSVDAAVAPSVESDPFVLVGIPAYNERTSIGDVVTCAREYADDVLVVDDGSADDTSAVAHEAGATVIEHERNRGYGASLKTILTEADRSRADYLVVLDGDGQHDPSDVPKLVDRLMNDDAALVIGSRFTDGSATSLPRYRRVGLFVVNVLTNLSMGVVRSRAWVSDTQSGFRAYDREAIESLVADESIGDEMGASTDILHHAHKNDHEIDEVPTTIEYDVENASTKNPVAHGVQLVMNIVRTIEEERPISSLGVPGVVCVLVGVAFAYLTMANYVDSGTFPLGFAVLSAFFALTGIFACFTSIILHSLNRRLD